MAIRTHTSASDSVSDPSHDRGGHERLEPSRRALLVGAAGLAGLPLLCSHATAQAATVKPTAPATNVPLKPTNGTGHGVGEPRGSDIAVAVGRDKQARFGLMFPKLAAFQPDDGLLVALANQMIDPRAPQPDISLSADGFDNPDIPAGYTYLGQFIDHDMTRDTTPLADAQADPHGLLNFDTPFFDLGSVYGRGPALDPQLYRSDRPGMLLIGGSPGSPDLPRTADNTAIIGDPRNDENLIVCQLQLAFLQLHNTFMSNGLSFAAAQQLTRWHYQWVIVHDFLPRILGSDVVTGMLSTNRTGGVSVSCKFYKPLNTRRPMMPLEYSVAAYRFGHSMIRAEYEMHEFSTLPLFDSSGPDLRGSQPIPPEARVDWNYFFEIPGLTPPDDPNLARLIDTKLSLPLSNLPPTVVAHVDGAILALAQRNLLRGKRLGLPAGQDVARALGAAPIPNERLGLTDAGWGGKAPLWFYVLKEAELLGGRQLGPVGRRIVAEVILGLLALDPSSYFNARGGWAPAVSPFGMGDLLRLAGAA